MLNDPHASPHIHTYADTYLLALIRAGTHVLCEGVLDFASMSLLYSISFLVYLPDPCVLRWPDDFFSIFHTYSPLGLLRSLCTVTTLRCTTNTYYHDVMHYPHCVLENTHGCWLSHKSWHSRCCCKVPEKDLGTPMQTSAYGKVVEIDVL